MKACLCTASNQPSYSGNTCTSGPLQQKSCLSEILALRHAGQSPVPAIVPGNGETTTAVGIAVVGLTESNGLTLFTAHAAALCTK